jgi:glycosyltransferase involved in cell wall biosynthesis
MTPLPPCSHRGAQVGPDRWKCSAPSLVVPGGTVSAKTCCDLCPLVPRIAVPAETTVKHGKVANAGTVPLVTCIMPTRDRPGFAALAIRCFERQDYPSKELIIIDDGREPLDPALLADARIRYIRLTEPASIGAKRDQGCREAQGSILLQWDDDDWHGPGRIRRQVEPLLAGQADITGLCDSLVLDVARWEFWQPSAESFRRLSFSGVHAGTLAFHRIVCDRYTCYPHVSLGEDVGFLRPALLAGCRLAAVRAERDFVIVRHGGNTWQLHDEFRRFESVQIPLPQAVGLDPAHFQLLQQQRSHTGIGPTSVTISPRRQERRRGLVRGPHQANSRGVHRSGWAHAFAALEHLDLPFLLDDFVEQSFCYGTSRPIYREPWVGIFHHPQAMPRFAENFERQRPDVYLQTAEFRASRPALRGAIALSSYLADWLAPRLQVPVLAVKHPSEPALLWSPDCLRGGARPKLLQVGFYLRNTLAIEQIPPAIPFVRARLLPHGARTWLNDWHRGVAAHWARLGTRRTWPGVLEVPCATNEKYDRLLASSIILTEVFDASANNVIVECITRGTPVVVNRHPAICEYVGDSYPLLFGAIEEVPRLLADRGRIVAAHKHLLAQRGPWLDARTFAADIGRFCNDLLRTAERQPIAS